MKKESPDDKEINLEEQKAPLKNTDNAFVIVSENGSPVMPEVSKGSKEKKDIQASVADKRQEQLLNRREESKTCCKAKFVTSYNLS